MFLEYETVVKILKSCTRSNFFSKYCIVWCFNAKKVHCGKNKQLNCWSIFVQKFVRIAQRVKVRLKALIGVLGSLALAGGWGVGSMFCVVMEAVVSRIYKTILNLCKFIICCTLSYSIWITVQYVYTERKKYWCTNKCVHVKIKKMCKRIFSIELYVSIWWYKFNEY